MELGTLTQMGSQELIFSKDNLMLTFFTKGIMFCVGVTVPISHTVRWKRYKIKRILECKLVDDSHITVKPLLFVQFFYGRDDTYDKMYF